MALFRTTADILDLALRNAGEVTNGNSPYEAQVLDHLNRVHFALICGGTIPIGKDKTMEIDELFPWAKAKAPIILELQPKITTGTVSLTQGSEVGAFSSAPAASVRGWHFRVKGRDELFKIASHTAGATAFELDTAYPDTTGAALTFELFKLDYDVVPDYVIVNDANNKVQWQEAAGVTLTGTLTYGTYTPAQLATHVASVMNTTGGTPIYTGSYSSVTRKFSIASDRGGGAAFIMVGDGDQSDFSVHKTLGLDDVSATNAASVSSTYVLGGIARMVEPAKIYKGTSREGSVYGIDSESFQRNYPMTQLREGIPDRFCTVREGGDGTHTIRFNAFPTEKTRVEIEHVPIPRDLKDSSASVPLVPRKHADVLEDAATFFLMLSKNDNRLPIYADLVKGKLEAMISQNRGALQRTAVNFGKIVPRKDRLGSGRRLTYGYENE